MTNFGILKIFCDGGARGNPGPAAGAFVAIDKNKVIKKSSIFLNETTNNVAEYEAVILALSWVAGNSSTLSYETIIFVLDSQLVAKQLTGEYKIKTLHLKKLATKAKALEKKINKRIFYKNVRRDKNKLADSLVNKSIDENI